MFPAVNITGYVPLLWSGEKLLELAFYKHYVPTVSGEQWAVSSER